MRRIYLDNNATTPIDSEVLAAMVQCWTEQCGNASSQHHEGRRARRTLESARERVAELVGAAPEQVLFTAGGTESNNLAIFGLAGEPPGHLITSSIEHPSVLGCFDQLERRGFAVTRLPVDSVGMLDAAMVADAIRPDTRLVSVMLANNETGAIQPIEEISRVCSDRGVPLHVDAVQAIGRMPLSFSSCGATGVTFSAHKIHGPVGVGVLLVRAKNLLRPVLAGGHQESQLRPGTESIALAVGLAAALNLACRNLSEDAARVRRLATQLENRVRERCADATLNGPTHSRLPNTVNLQFPELDAQAAVIALDLLGVACSTGSACASGASTPSHVLLAMGLTEKQARSSIRFSLSRRTSDADVEQAIDAILRVVMQQASRARHGSV